MIAHKQNGKIMMNNLILDTMILSFQKSIAILTLTREKSLNAMSPQFFNDFNTVFSHLSTLQTPIKALIITGQGQGFCVGADLKNFTNDRDIDLSESLRKNFIPLVKALRNLKIPTIAAVNGYAVGAGMSIVLACDFCIAAKSAEFSQAFINIGLVPDAGSTYYLPRMVGRAKANEMMMLGENIRARDAFNIGLIYKCVEDDQLISDAMRLADKLASRPLSAIIQIRVLLDKSQENSFDQQLEAEADAQKIAGQSDNFIEGIQAFLEKRLPIFNK